MMANASPAQVEADGILEYQYEPLITDDHVRLLILDPAASLGNPLRCSIVQYAYYAELCSDDNTRHQHFAAVSYTWGSSLPTHQLQIANPSVPGTGDAASTYLKITATVDSLLRHLRKPHKAVPLWIDAVCLNQMDSREKAQQAPPTWDTFTGLRRRFIFGWATTTQTMLAGCSPLSGRPRFEMSGTRPQIKSL